jgi:heptosyltransferase-3
MSAPRTFLIVSLRYIGDVLLSTPLARSIKAAHPEAAVDFLVFEGTEGILGRNPDVRRVISVRPGSRSVSDLLGHFKEYDVAIGVNASDRTAFQLLSAGKTQFGFADPRPKEWWKRRFFTRCTTYDPKRHVVELLLGQLRHLGIPPIPEVSIHFGEEDLTAAREAAGEGDFVLLHPYTRWEYKKWPAANWAGLCRRIEEDAGERALFTVAPGSFEGGIRAEILETGVGADRFVSRELSLPQLAALVSLAKAYVGVDTVVTHIAAATGRNTVAIFGPTPPWRWGPWPNGHPVATPYEHRGGIQRRRNITIVQKDWECAACDRMGCDHAPESASRCLVELSVDEVYSELFRLTSSTGI